MNLLDTSVLSELRKLSTGRADPRVRTWAQTTESEANFLSVVTILEIETGILRLQRYHEAQAMHLRQWLDTIVLPDFYDRIIVVDVAIAQQAARFHAPRPRPANDALIAATAVVRRLTLITRNVTDFAGTDVQIVNPWAA